MKMQMYYWNDLVHKYNQIAKIQIYGGDDWSLEREALKISGVPQLVPQHLDAALLSKVG